MSEGITTIEEAYAAAKLEEMGGSATLEVAATPPADPGEVAPDGADQPSGPDPEAQALVDSLVEQPADEHKVMSFDDPRFWKQELDLNGELVTLGEMRNGYLRQADYTQKTQALAEERRSLEEAGKFLETFTADPAEFARALAVEYGWIDPNMTSPINKIDLPQVLSQEDLDARLQEMLDERVSSDPRVLQAQATEAKQLISDEFERIGQEHNVVIPQELRDSLLDEAQQRGVFDLELLFTARLASRQRSTDNLIRSGAVRPRSAGGLGSQPEQAPAPSTVEEAWAQAKAELAAGR